LTPLRHEHALSIDHQRYYPTVGLDVSGDASLGINLRDFVALLRQNVLWLALAVFVGASLGVAASLILPKRYAAEGQLVIDTREINIPEFESLRSARTFEPWGGRSEAQVLASRELISTVATKLDLQHDPHFNPTLRDGPVLRWVSGITWIPDSWREELRQAPEFGPRIQTGIAKQIASTLNVMSEEKSYAINVRYTSYDPLLSANFVNTLMQYYLDQDVRAKRGVVDQARAQLKERLEYLQSDLAATWARIRSLEGQPTALETQLGTINAQQTEAIALQRREAAAEQASVENDLAQLNSGLARNQISVINDKLVTPRLKALWEDEAKLQRNLAELSLGMLPTNPRFQQVQNGFNKVQVEIRREVTAIRGGLLQRAHALKSRGEMLEEQLSQAKEAASTSAQHRAELHQLSVTAQSKQALYDQYRNRYEQTVANAELVKADARIISHAEPPIQPSYPSSMVRAMIGGLMGLLASIAAMVCRRWLHDRVETLAEAQQICGVAALGGIPRVGGWARRASLTDAVLDEPQSALAATIRGILYQVALSRTTNPVKVVMVTSPFRQDGKSSLVAAMVRLGARDGLRCLALECDFYRPSLARKINVTPRRYLNDSLSQEPALADLVVEDRESGAHFVMGKPMSDRSGQLPHNTMRIRDVIEAARQHYDLIVIDTPPMLAVIDPLLVSQLADGVVLMLPWRTISHRRAREVAHRLAGFACPLIGVVLSRIVGRADSSYGYYGYAQAESLT
jgi:succinoglycan biosynthesis transport protein ExoP